MRSATYADSHYAYIEQYGKWFSEQLGVDDVTGFTIAHGDKARQYRDLIEELAEYYGVEVTDREGISAVVSKASEFLKVDFFSEYHFEGYIKQLLMKTEPFNPGGRW